MPGRGDSGQPMTLTSKDTRKALELRLGILSDDEVRRMSVANIQSEHLLDRHMKPQIDGILDPRMGTTDRDERCWTCGCTQIECPGHFGHIELAQPVYHVGYITNIIKVLRCICCECGRLRLRDKQAREQIRRRPSARTRFKRVHELCSKIKECELDSESGIGCGHTQPVYKKVGLAIERQYDGNKGPDRPGAVLGDPKKILEPEDVRRILARINDEDLKLLGMDPKESRPEWMVISTLAVAPPPVRPSVQAGDGVRSEDDLTYAYRMVVRTNNELRRYMEGGQPKKAQDAVHRNLQLLVATLMDNNLQDQPKQKHTSGKPIKDIRSRLKGKEGRVRGNLMGKRVDFSARTVITPDPILKLDQLGVPELIAMDLTVPEHVTVENIKEMRQLVANGPTKWPGAKYIIRHDGRQIDLSEQKKMTEHHLEEGFIVERQLRDGDYVVFNRQPSLHKMSLMGHRVKVLPFQTFRLNLSVTAPYNADFDGDEMNMHVPQSMETKAEVKEIMAVPKQVVAPKDNKPVMGIFQDALLGVSLFTLRDTFVELDQMMNLLMWINFDGALPPPAILKPRPLWTGKQILSLIIPAINYVKQDDDFKDWACPKDKHVLIKNGELLCGTTKKQQVGASSGGLVHIVWRDYGPEACRDFLSDLQNIVNNWLVHHGFTVGVQDIIASEQTVSTIGKALAKYKRKVQRITQITQRGQLQTLPGKGMYESFEAEVNRTLRDAIERAGKLAHQELESSNRLNNMVSSGSKGSKLNISQIMACVGQQNVEGKRIPFGFNRRSLPHFSKDDFGPESKGFVTNCYVAGLTPQEFYFHAMGGREGLIDTAVKTAETGYIQRRLIKALEDIQVKYDATVRTSRDQVIQFLYGEDGMAADQIENLSIETLKMANTDLEKKHKFFSSRADMGEKRLKLKENVDDSVIEQMNIGDDEDFGVFCDKVHQEYKQILQDREDLRNCIIKNGDPTVHLPVNVRRLIWNCKERFEIKNRKKSDMSPEYVINATNELLTKSIKVYQEPRLAASHLFVDANQDATWLFKIYLRQLLSSKQVIQYQRLSKDSFDWLLGEIKTRYEQALVHPGEMVGSIGAQSMGEPATQMTLNTFHNAGVASKNVTLGVPRLKEIINVAKTIKTPSLKIFLEDLYKQSQKDAHELGNKIEHTTLSHIVASSAIYYDPDPKDTIIKADEDLLRFHFETELDEIDTSNLSPWLLRFEVDKEKMIQREISIEHIDNILQTKLEDVQIIHHRDLKLQKIIFRLRLPDFEADEDETVPMILKQIEDGLLNELTLKGFPEITKVAYTKEAPECKEVQYDPETGAHSIIKGNWLIETDGVALKKVLGVDKVDYKKTSSNDIIEILTVLGVEAARYSLINELRFVLGSYGIYVNYRHLATLCDIMTNRGILTAITRHGINRVDSGALRKCSFEETVEILLEAAFHAEVDPLSGVTENIIMGQLAPYGTGCFDVMMDTDMLKEATTITHIEDKSDGDDDLLDEITTGQGQSSHGGGTPQWRSPKMPMMAGGMTPGMTPVGMTPFGGFTPAYNLTGGETPAITSVYGAQSPTPEAIHVMGGQTPGITPGGMKSGYSPTVNQYPRAMGAASPAYGIPATTPAYQMNPAGMSPAYQVGSNPYGMGQTAGGNMGGAYSPVPNMAPGQGAQKPPTYTSGVSPVYRVGMASQSPVYGQPNPAAYSPTGGYGNPEPAYTPGAPPPPGSQQQQPDRKD